MTDEAKRIEVVNRRGDKRAVFVRNEDGWTPDWFYEGERQMLRFKDHQWLTFSHVQVAAADGAEALPDGGAAFSGTTVYGDTDVAWTVTVQADPEGSGFLVECSFTPARSIELVEAYATFETPYDYDGLEEATTVIGMNPVYKWRGPEMLSPPIWKMPGWFYTRPQAARITGPCDAPYLCQSLVPAAGGPAEALGNTDPRHVMVVGDWTVCRGRDVFVNPTRDTKNDPHTAFQSGADTKGYKYIVGAVNWSSAWVKDPNVLFVGGQPHQQRLAIDFSTELPGGSNDAFYLSAWQRAAAFSFPADGKVEAWEKTSARGVTWQSAMASMHEVFGGKGSRFLFDPAGGMGNYALGSRPKSWDVYGWGGWPRWAGGMHYRAVMTGDENLAARCEDYDARYAEWAESSPLGGINSTTLPSCWWAFRQGGRGTLAEVLRPVMVHACEESAAENGKKRKMDYGFHTGIAEGLLLGAATYGLDELREQGIVLLGEINGRLDENFWAFNCGAADSLVHGGQVRSVGHGHAIVANLLAFEATGDQAYLTAAHRFARFLLTLCYACHNGSRDPEFDWRGWCNGSNGGRDQIAEFPPWETTCGHLSIAALMTKVDMEPGFHDLHWYFSRTGLAQFPAARTLKRVMDETYHPQYVPRDEIASEAYFYDASEYLAYENPHDQTLQVSYQGADCLLAELLFGGGLARASDGRLGVTVPAAALLDLSLRDRRDVLVWNPLGEAIESAITVTWPDGSTAEQPVAAGPRELVKLSFSTN